MTYLYFFKANELPRTRSLFLPSGSSDNPTPTAPKARVWTKYGHDSRGFFMKNKKKTT